GSSPDVVEVLADARRQGAVALAITNEPDSPLAATAETVIDLQAGPELAVAASKTYVAELAAVALLSDALAGGGAEAELAALPGYLAKALETEQHAQQAARELRGLRQCAVIGRRSEERRVGKGASGAWCVDRQAE